MIEADLVMKETLLCHLTVNETESEARKKTFLLFQDNYCNAQGYTNH